MSTFVIGGLMVAGLAYLAKHGQRSDAEYVEKMHKLEREIQETRDRVMLQQF